MTDKKFESINKKLSRRDWLLMMIGSGAAALIGQTIITNKIFGEGSASYTPITIDGCIVSPQQTEGPYFVDERLNRSDISTDPATGVVKPGVPLTLKLRVLQVSNAKCAPLPNAVVDIWHCDALGIYSDVIDNIGAGADTRGEKFLRGYQVTDADGKVEFQTIYPGWYQGRNIHIHYKVRTNPESFSGHEFTSQLYFDENVTNTVHAQAPYNQKGNRDTLNSNDYIYRGGGDQSMLRLTKNNQGYVGTYDIGFQTQAT